jgi:hypothetical protein
LRHYLVDERVSVSAGELVDFAPALIFADELANLPLRYLGNPRLRLKRIFADLGEDRLAEGRRLTSQNSFEVKVLVIGGAGLDPHCETKPVIFRRFVFTHSGSMTPKVLVGGIPFRLKRTTPIPLLGIGCDAQGMLALPVLLAGGIFASPFVLEQA